MTAIDWPGLMRLGMVQLGLVPEVFWRLTPAELQMLAGPEPTGQAAFTRARLAALGLVSFSTPDPSRKNEAHEYTGPLLSAVLREAGIAQAATLHLVALDKYRTDLKLAPIRDVPVILALKSDGQLLEPRNFGPVYMTFPYGGVKLDPNIYNAAWVWQLYRIEERPGGA